MSSRVKLTVSAVAIVAAAMLSVATLQARAIEKKAQAIRAGMSLREVMQTLDGWSMINTHPADSRAIPHGTGPEFNGYSGEVYVLTPVRPDGSETDLRKISKAEFEARLERMLSRDEPWTVYFNFRTIPTDSGILVRFDGKGRVAEDRTQS
jgi:Tfp pilus assembly protein PilV